MAKKGIDLLLVNPSTRKKVYEDLGEQISAIEPPFVAALAAGFVRSRGYEVKILDANVDAITPEKTAEIVKDYNPFLTTIIVHGQQPSASTQMMGAVGDTCRAIKDKINTPILLSGVHPSSLPRRTLEEEACDFVARGEVYHTILGLLRRDRLEDVPGLCYKKDGLCFFNKAAPLIDEETINTELREVAWDLLPPMSRYRAHNWHSLNDIENRSYYGSLYASLGCPFNCEFCCINAERKASLADNPDKNSSIKKRLNILDSYPRDGSLDSQRILNDKKPNMVYWDPNITLERIEYLVENEGIRHLKFIDEMFVLDKRYVNAIADGIIKRGYNINIWAYARVDTVKDVALLEKLKKAGFNWLCLGIESASKHVRDGADKRYSNEDIIAAVKRVESAGIEVLGNYMYGLRDDTIESMKETLSLAKELNTAWYNGYACQAYPGSRLYVWARERGIPLPGDPGVLGGWTAASHHSYYNLPLPTETLSSADVLRFRDMAFHDYISNPSYLNLIRRKYGEKAVLHLEDLNKYKIKRYILGGKSYDEI